MGQGLTSRSRGPITRRYRLEIDRCTCFENKRTCHRFARFVLMKQLSQQLSGKTSLYFNHVGDGLVSDTAYAVIAISSIGWRWKSTPITPNFPFSNNNSNGCCIPSNCWSVNSFWFQSRTVRSFSKKDITTKQVYIYSTSTKFMKHVLGTNFKADLRNK